MSEKPNLTLPAKVDKIIESTHPNDSEKAQITIEGADTLYSEIRIENKLTTADGEQVRLRKDAEVEVTIEADPAATTPSPQPSA